MKQVNITVVSGSTAPRELGQSIEITNIYITEQGTESMLPIVDFVGKLSTGESVYFCLTGRMVNCVSAVVRGVNARIHGREEP